MSLYSDDNLMWRAHRDEKRSRADTREESRCKELNNLPPEFSVNIVSDYHVRIQFGHATADYWPRTGATRIGGQGVTRYLSVSQVVSALQAEAAR